MRSKTTITKEFWMSREKYPPVTHNFERRYIDVGLILRYITGDTYSMLDLGCGEGQLPLILRELTTIKEYYCYDLSSVFMNNLIDRWGTWPGLNARVCDFVKTELNSADLSICMGALLYVFDDVLLSNMLSRLDTKMFICRVPCSMSTRIEVNKYSEEFESDYAAVYRTIPEYMNLLSNDFHIVSIDRCYPDEIESKYGTKQYFFVCERN